MAAEAATGRLVEVPAGLLGREVPQGRVRVTTEMIAAYARAVGDAATLAEACVVAPPTFCVALRPGFEPAVTLAPEAFDMHGGHDLEFHRPIRAGAEYEVAARILDVYEKTGRTGTLVVVVREVLVREADGGPLAARMIERQVVRRRPEAGSPPE